MKTAYILTSAALAAIGPYTTRLDYSDLPDGTVYAVVAFRNDHSKALAEALTGVTPVGSRFRGAAVTDAVGTALATNVQTATASLPMAQGVVRSLDVDDVMDAMADYYGEHLRGGVW